jgi:Arc/MetJ-type ribon-helix-helix transcriptional regulator
MDNTITLTPELIQSLRDRVATGEYVSESDLICEALSALDTSKEAASASPQFEAWLRNETAAAYDEIEKDPTQFVTLEEIQQALSAEYARATKAG